MKRPRKAFHNPASPDKRLKALASTVSETSDDVSKPIGYETLKENVS